ncbi:MAG: DNA polymerase I [Herpetosiphonaceae bacterium]|nr:DNA polymerase I [Herpetosiphonaceae bacterium]
MAQPKLMLVDGHAVAFRAFHALRDANLRSTATGEPTYAIFGFLQIVLTQLQKMVPEYAAVSFDMGRTFRHDDFADYKAGRGEAPDEFHAQLGRIKQVVTALNIPIYMAANYEADDVIGTLGTQATAQQVNTFILTGDTDTLQLVNEQVHVLLSVPYRQAQEIKEYDVAVVAERYGGLRPEQLTDLRGLKGDASDNIPGVKGIGEQGAITLLNQFGTVESIYDHLDEVPKRYQKVLTGQREIAMLSKQLATIRCDVPVELDLEHCRLRDYDRDNVIALFRELEFGRLISKLPEVGTTAQVVPAAAAPDAKYKLKQAKPKLTKTTDQIDMFDIDSVFGGAAVPAATPVAPVASGGHVASASGHYRSVTTEEQLNELVTVLQTAPHVAFDTETNGLDPFRSDLVGFSFATEPGSGWYLPVAHTGPDIEQLPAETIRAALRPVLEDGKRAKVAHNAKFDLMVLRRWGCDVHGVVFDSMIAAQLLGKRGGLKELALYELDVEMTEITTLIGTGKAQTTFDTVPLERATAYAGADADMTLRLYRRLAEQLGAVPRIQHIFETIEMPLIPVLADMEWAGIKIDVEVLKGLSTQMYHRLQEIEQELTVLAGQPFNPGSSQQVSDILFGKLQLPTAGLSKVKSGHYSITADVLDKLRGQHEIIDLILEYRQLTKLKSTYIDALPLLVDQQSRVHTSYNQIGSSTGRLSSQNPNLQNIPIRSEQGREIRRAFVSEPGCQLLAADYSQIELRILAHTTQDPALLEIFKQGLDIHAATAARLFGVPLDQITKNQRRIAKMTVFGTVYGISSFGLSARTDLSRSEAQLLITGLFETYPGLRAFFDHTLDEGRNRGYVETLLGRRRYMPELTATNGAHRQAAEREAINAPIQGTSADLIKMAMVRLHEELQRRALATKMLLQVHDELVLEVPDAEVDEVRQLVQVTMSDIYPELNVPLEVHLATGTDWDSMEE